MGDYSKCSVVGYASAETKLGNKISGANFVNVNGTASKLSDLSVVGYAFDGEFTGEVYASQLNEFGATPMKDGVYVVWQWADWEEDGVRYTGWVDTDGEFCGDDVELPLGAGLWIQSDDPNNKIQCAGQVYDEAVPCQLVVGNRICANPCPATIKLGTCVITGYEFEEEFTGEVYASKLNEIGATEMKDGVYIIWQWADWEEDGVRYTGWVDTDGEFCGDQIDIEMGDGLWVQSDSDEYNFVFPTVL